MFGCSGLVVARKFPEYSVGGLLAVVILQGIGYGLITGAFPSLRPRRS